MESTGSAIIRPETGRRPRGAGDLFAPSAVSGHLCGAEEVQSISVPDSRKCVHGLVPEKFRAVCRRGASGDDCKGGWGA